MRFSSHCCFAAFGLAAVFIMIDAAQAINTSRKCKDHMKLWADTLARCTEAAKDPFEAFVTGDLRDCQPELKKLDDTLMADCPDYGHAISKYNKRSGAVREKETIRNKLSCINQCDQWSSAEWSVCFDRCMAGYAAGPGGNSGPERNIKNGQGDPRKKTVPEGKSSKNNLDKFDLGPSYASPNTLNTRTGTKGTGTKGTKSSQDGVAPNKSTKPTLFIAPGAQGQP
jgi:hypothetical protein